MSPELQADNIASWNDVGADIERHPQNTSLALWKVLALRVVRDGIEVGLNRYFRAGISKYDLLFSTRERGSLRHVPYVTVGVDPEGKLRIAYRGFPSSRPQYTLEYELGFPTLRRFLNQLWIETVTDPLPEELRGFSAPILTPFTE
jgi:hypothetical protein